jgi:hypothetical protein
LLISCGPFVGQSTPGLHVEKGMGFAIYSRINGHTWGEVEEIGAKNQITFVWGLIKVPIIN